MRTCLFFTRFSKTMILPLCVHEEEKEEEKKETDCVITSE